MEKKPKVLVIMAAYNGEKYIREQIDSLPFNNPCVHDLTSLLCENVTEEEFYRLIKDTYLFKLSYKQFKSSELTAEENNLYNKIKHDLHD